jgi:hypothetical protein
MHTTALTVLATFATTALGVSTQIVRNYCGEVKYLSTLLNATGLDGPFELPSGELSTSQVTNDMLLTHRLFKASPTSTQSPAPATPSP